MNIYRKKRDTRKNNLRKKKSFGKKNQTQKNKLNKKKQSQRKKIGGSNMKEVAFKFGGYPRPVEIID